MEFALIPAGEFMMGSPETEAGRGDDEQQHSVVITKPFYVGVYEVTQAEFHRVTGRTPSLYSATGKRRRDVTGLDTSRFPVENVSWRDATDFCRRLSQSFQEARAGRAYRLPTEAEWEYACRAGTNTVFHGSNSLSSAQANFDGTHPYGGVPEGVDLKRPTTVGSYKPNPWGLHDMHGNVWEFCQDWYGEDYYRMSPAYDPRGPASGDVRVARGGAWGYRGENCRAALRIAGLPPRNEFGGFRVVLVHGKR